MHFSTERIGKLILGIEIRLDIHHGEPRLTDSGHGFRNGNAMRRHVATLPIEIAQQTLGHAWLATTTIYVTTEAKRRMRAAQRFWQK